MNRAIVTKIAAMYGLDADLLGGQILVESAGQADAFRFEPAFYRHYIKDNPRAVARTHGPLAACSYGPLQIMYEVAVEIGFHGEPHELFDFETGLYWGARYLASLVTWAKGDLHAALAAYNGGKAGNEPDATPDRNHAYADKVFAFKERYLHEAV